MHPVAPVASQNQKSGDVVRGWQYGKSIVECNRYMLDHQLSTDVSFEVGPPDGARSQIRAHKYVLISRSAVFESMLFGLQRQMGHHPLIQQL